jgi:hypothetical protein
VHVGLFRRTKQRQSDLWLSRFQSNFTIANTVSGLLQIDGENFQNAFGHAAAATDRAMPNLREDPGERTAAYLKAVDWLTTITPDDAGQLFARIWIGGAEVGFPAGRRAIEQRVGDGEIALDSEDIPKFAAVYAINWGDLYAGGCMGFGEMVAYRDRDLIPELFKTVEGWYELPAGSIAQWAEGHPLGTATEALEVIGPTWNW